MLLFRSEEHLERWLTERSLERGETLTPERQWELALAWHSNRLDPDWRKLTPERAEEVFAGVGLTGDFWKMTG